MTSLAVTLSIDSRGPCALYIITDSRISWSQRAIWDGGQKAFVSRFYPDIFGFCGDAFFPPAILRQVIEQIDAGLLFDEQANSDERHAAIGARFRVAIEAQRNAPLKAFSVFHGSRDGMIRSSRFRLWRLQYAPAGQNWTDTEINLNESTSYLAHIDGSGKSSIEGRAKSWAGSSAEGTSRAAIWSFCEALRSGIDPYTGGAPQLVGLWRNKMGQNFGFVWQGKKVSGRAQSTL